MDLVFYGNQRQLEYDFVVAPGADPGRIAWRIDGARASVDAEGNLALNAPDGKASFKKPVLYQMDGDKRTSVEGAFAVNGNEIKFRVGSYDRSKELIVDPVLSYATYLAGSGWDNIANTTGPGIQQAGTSQGLAVDSAGSAYVTGYTKSIDFPTKNPYLSAPPAKGPAGSPVSPGLWPTAFVTKFSPDGSSLVYSTYLGGNGSDYGYAIALDSGGNAYVTGQTSSSNYPATSGAYQTVCAPVPNNTGESSASSNCNSSDYSVFVTKLNSTGTSLVYSTFLGGYASWSYATAIAVDGAGRAYIAGNENVICSTGYTFPSCFPTTSGAVISGTQPIGADPQYAFVAAFDPTGAHLLYSTLVGDQNFTCIRGCGGDTYGTGIAVDASGYFYLVGQTQASTLPTTAGVIQRTPAPLGSTGTYVEDWRGFVAKFNPVTSAGGASLAYATYLGGQAPGGGDYISGITIDSASNAYIVGYTNSKDFPVTSGAYNTVCGQGGTCAAGHVTKLNPSGTAILWSTYVGGARSDGSDALYFTGPIELDGSGNVYVMGQSGAGFQLVDPVEPTPGGGYMQVVVAELDPTGAKLLFSTTIGSNGLHTAGPAGLAVDSLGNIYLAGNHNGPDLKTTPGAFQMTASADLCCYHGFVAKIAPVAPGGPTIKSGGAGVAPIYSAVPTIQPGEWVSIYGTNLASTTATWNGDFPTFLAGTRVTIDGKLAYLWYVSPTQINLQVPEDTFTGAVPVVVTTSVASATSNVTLAQFAPSFLLLDSKHVTGIILRSDGSGADGGGAYDIIGPTGSSLGYPTVAAKAGDSIELYGVGFGPTTPAVTPGQAFIGAAQTNNTVSLTINNVTLYPPFVGLSEAGLYQINLTVPSGLGTGDVSLQATVAGVTTQTGVVISLQ